MSTRVAVLGATGVYGRHLIPRLINAGYRVRALVRNPASAVVAQQCGAETVAADIFDEASLRAGLGNCDVAMNLATSLPSPTSRTGDFAANDRLRREGVPIFLRACQAAGVHKVLQQSIAMTHAGSGEAWADEDTLHSFEDDSIASAAIRAIRDMEQAVISTDLDWLILRGGLFYGPGTGFDDDWFARARAGKLRLPDAGQDYVSVVHIADMATATVAALSAWPSRRALIVADDRPARWREVFEYVSSLAGTAPPEPGGRLMMPSFRVSNQRARAALGWAPGYPDFRAGLIR